MKNIEWVICNKEHGAENDEAHYENDCDGPPVKFRVESVSGSCNKEHSAENDELTKMMTVMAHLCMADNLSGLANASVNYVTRQVAHMR